MLLASNYDQSRFFKAADMTAEKKLRIKDVTEETIGADNLCVAAAEVPERGRTGNLKTRDTSLSPIGVEVSR